MSDQKRRFDASHKALSWPDARTKIGQNSERCFDCRISAGPLMAVYYATKAYVISFSEALANELQGTGVTVTCLCPGATDTGFQKRAGTEETRLFRTMRPMDASAVARHGYQALMKGKPLVISGFRNWLLAESLRVSPRKLVTAISRKILDVA
jgi:uncharacterized protein